MLKSANVIFKLFILFLAVSFQVFSASPSSVCEETDITDDFFARFNPSDARVAQCVQRFKKAPVEQRIHMANAMVSELSDIISYPSVAISIKIFVITLCAIL